MVNAYYVRAAIEANTGIRLSIYKTVEYLLSEGLITENEAAYELVDPYENLFDGPSFNRVIDTDTELGLPDYSFSLED